MTNKFYQNMWWIVTCVVKISSTKNRNKIFFFLEKRKRKGKYTRDRAKNIVHAKHLGFPKIHGPQLRFSATVSPTLIFPRFCYTATPPISIYTYTYRERERKTKLRKTTKLKEKERRERERVSILIFFGHLAGLLSTLRSLI